MAAVLTVSGCTGLTGAAKPTATNAPASSGTLSTSATTLSFGNVMIGSSSTQNLTLSNTGSATVTVSQAAITGTGFSMSGATSSVAIAAGQNHTFQVQFSPKASGSASGSIAIVSDATNSSLDVSLSGAGMTPLTISAQPQGETVTAGQTATFAVTASGTGTLAYQWKKNGSNIGGATAASYTTPATTISDSGSQFSVLVTDADGSVASSSATLTVTAAPVAPSIAAQPASQTVTAGQTANFNVAVTGTSPLSYQWKKNGATISGATAPFYTTPAATSADDGAKFTVTVSNSAGSATSNAATLTVDAPPTITAQPAGQIVSVGQTATFSVTATGTGTVTYQWKKNGSNISGAVSASYTTAPATASDNGAQFSVTVSDNVSSLTSNAATLTVNSPPAITAQPAGASVIAGQTAAFSVSATGTAPLSYQWRKNGTPINGANSSSYTTSATATSDNGTQFTVTISNNAGNVTSNPATLTVATATFVLNLSQTSLSFGNVNIGLSSVLPVTLTNAGNSSVTISNVSLSGAGFTASGAPSGQILTAGQHATLDVTFGPSSAGAVNGSVTVTSNATNSPAAISLSGTGMQALSHSIKLSWTGSTSTVSGYNIYRSQVSGGPYSKENSGLLTGTMYTDTAVLPVLTYYYVVTSVDSGGIESADSNQVSATVP